MRKLKIRTFDKPINKSVVLPGSKSITNRVFILAALAKGKTLIKGALESEDTKVMLKALEKFGLKIKKIGKDIEINGCAGKFSKTGKLKINVENSGTSMRFLAAIAALRDGETIIYGKPRMHQRPIEILLKGLRGLGIDANSLKNTGCPPVIIKGNGQIKGGKISLDGSVSSQFFSALLHIAPFANNPVEIVVTKKLVSKPFLAMTISILKNFGVDVEYSADFKNLKIKPQQMLNPKEIDIESDATAASYFWSLAAVIGGKIAVGNIPKNSVQGDKDFIEVLEKMGCKISERKNDVLAEGPKNSELKPLGNINLEAIPDAAMTAVVLAVLAKGDSKITGLSTLRDKETDRIAALVKELKKMGAKVEEGADYIKIFGKGKNSLHGAEIETYDDHRMAMCFAFLGSVIPSVVILDPGCVSKTFPNFWKYFESVRYKDFENIVLTGMRGSGKSKIGKLVAKNIGWDFIDTDEEIEKNAKKSINQIVEENGWDYFRDLENQACRKVAKLKNTIIATGGGALIFQRNIELLNSSFVVFLNVKISELKRRISDKTDRPSLTGINFTKEIEEVWKQRKEKYYEVADMACECSKRLAEENAKKVLTKLKKATRITSFAKTDL